MSADAILERVNEEVKEPIDLGLLSDYRTDAAVLSAGACNGSTSNSSSSSGGGGGSGGSGGSGGEKVNDKSKKVVIRRRVNPIAIVDELTFDSAVVCCEFHTVCEVETGYFPCFLCCAELCCDEL